MEGKEVDVEKHDLGDEDVVTEGERGGENAFGGGLDVRKSGEGGHLGWC